MAEERKVNTKTRLQDVRDFTVQIRHAETDDIVGTGIAISMDGEIITCRHVFEAALIAPEEEFEVGEVGVYFPRARGEKKDRRAKLARHFSDSEDDVVVLQLIGRPPPLAPEDIAILSDGERSQDNPFRSYGYRRLVGYDAGWADGKIMGSVESPDGATLLIEPVQLDSKHINRGMSGSAVLDTRRNLVVGVVSETYFSDRSGKDRDTGWAVNAEVLTFDPLEVPIYEGEFLELKESARPSDEVMSQAIDSIGQNLSLTEYPAPSPPEEWVGREDLLDHLNQDWADPDAKVVGLIGFGGEGKSSLASRWIADLMENKDPEQPEGLFWWSFYDRRSVDEFFEAALTYLSRKNEKLLDDVKSPNARARLISGMLYNGSYLFVLDGLEVMQKQEGDDYGEFGSDDLRQFLEYFSAPGHSSFCLITSRAPLFDLMDQTTFVHRDVTRLSEGEGCALLKKVGVMGSDSDLKRAVELWDGHAITLSLIGAYLAKDHGGDIAHLDDIDAPTADEQRYERVHRIMRRYDECLSDDERAFLLLFSAFRTPVEAAAFDKVFRTKTEKSALNAPIAALTHDEFKKLIDRLLNNRILRFDPIEAHYTTHPLIRAHYFALLSKGDDGQAQDTHRQIKDYYLSVAGDVPHHPTLDDLAPLIEVVHHACQAGAYDEAGWIYWERINQRDRGVLVLELGAYETDLATLKEFFHDHDICKEPRLSAPNHRGWILHELGFCLSSLGRLTEAALFYERGTPSGLDSRSVMNACKTHLNLTDLYLSLGQLTRGAKANASALDFAAQADDISGKRNALAYRGKVAHLRGDAKFAESSFRQAEVLERRDDGTASHLCSRRGIHHADHLRRIDRAGYALSITEANLEICERNHWADDLSSSHRVLGDLAADAGDHVLAGPHYETALRIARSITVQFVLIEALLARGRWQAKQAAATGEQSTLQQAFSDLNEALRYAQKGGYRIYEADIRIALAWAHLADQQPEAARQEAKRALAMSKDMGYYWGKLDANEVLKKL